MGEVVKIGLDPGHGNKTGAAYGGAQEDAINLAVVFRASNLLRSWGYQVFLTRDRDESVPLPERVRMMNEAKVDAYVSVHCNATAAGGEKAHGIEVYYRDDGDLKLATCVNDVLARYSGRADVGIFRDEIRLKKRLAVLNNDRIPCCLLELAYLSNPEDRAYLVENVSTAGEILAHAIDWYAKQESGVEKTNWPA